ncbi:MAG: PepSY-associated TM helix domain-containing protein [Bacteroidales bacterium]
MKNKIIKWTRIIHRDLGYFMVGISLIYGFSGILLNHINGKDPAFKVRTNSFTLAPNLSVDELTAQWSELSDVPSLNKAVANQNNDNIKLYVKGGVGNYSPADGSVSYQTKTKKPIAYAINKLHYNRVDYWTWFGDFFAISLIFFALSGLIMVRGKNSFKGRGKWFVIAGLIIPILYLILG